MAGEDGMADLSKVLGWQACCDDDDGGDWRGVGRGQLRRRRPFCGAFEMSADEARRELDQIQRDKTFMAAFLNRDHPDHQRHVLRARRLNRLAAGLDPDA